MLLTIVPKDNVVTKDGRTCVFDLSGYASLNGLRAVQWVNTSGHIENDNFGASATTFKPNEQITSIAPYQDIIDAWQVQADLEDNTIVIPPTDPTELPPPINETFCLMLTTEDGADVADFSGEVKEGVDILVVVEEPDVADFSGDVEGAVLNAMEEGDDVADFSGTVETPPLWAVEDSDTANFSGEVRDTGPIMVPSAVVRMYGH